MKTIIHKTNASFYIPEDKVMIPRGKCMNKYPGNIIPNLEIVYHNWQCGTRLARGCPTQ